MLSVSLCLWVSHSFRSSFSILQAVKHKTLTQCWANVGPPSTSCWTNISPVLGYHVLFGATLNVGQHHSQWANINPALVQSIVPIPSACRYRQYEVLTRTELILASTGDAGPTFNRHWVGVGLYSPPAVSRPASYWTQPQQTRGIEQEVLVWCWASVADGVPALDHNWVNVLCLLGATLCFAHRRGSNTE